MVEEDQIRETKTECEGHQLIQIDSYEYLGTMIHQKRKLQREVQKQVQKATNAY